MSPARLGALILAVGCVPLARAETPYHLLHPEPEVVALALGLEGEALAAALDRLEAEGVRVPVAVAGVGFVLVDEPGLDAKLARAGIGAPLRSALSEADAAAALREAPSAGGLLRWWADGFSVPEYSPEERAVLDEAARQAEICAGAKRLEDVVSLRCGPSAWGTVHFAAGRCVVSLILPESVGPSNVFDWNSADVSKVRSEVIRSLDWWSLKSGHRLSFVLVDHGTVATDEEPALLSMADEDLYIEDCLTNLGYTTTNCPYQQLGEMNEALKQRHGGHWAYTQFVLNAESFPGSAALAYAYLGGPHTVALLGNGVLTLEELDHVVCHEMGHIFQAADEYSGACSGCNGGPYGYLDARNGNCISCPTQTGACVMRGSSQYTTSQMHDLENQVHPCAFTKQMAGIWDSDLDGVWDVLETYPETVMLSAVPDTIDAPESLRLQGRTWDTPYPAPARYTTPVTVNRINRVEYRVDGSATRQAQALDGLYTAVSEDFEFSLPPLGGGTHFALIQGVNSMGIPDPTPARIDFFIYDVKLVRDEIEVLQEGPDIVVVWKVDGEDFGSTYELYRRLGIDAPEELLATLTSSGVRNERFAHWDRQARAGTEYVYRLVVDIPDKGRKELGLGRLEATIAPPVGKIAAVAPNPSRGNVLVSVTVPVGPQPDAPDILIPQAGGLRGEEDDDGGSGSSLLWRDVRIRVHDVRGRLVRDLGRFREQETRTFNVGWDGRYRDGTSAPPGVYFVRITLEYDEAFERIVLIR
ncbi:MAG: hypothetical protein ACT4PE_03400 [Candidatus Eiseniibacteriota bacterium]